MHLKTLNKPNLWKFKKNHWTIKKNHWKIKKIKEKQWKNQEKQGKTKKNQWKTTKKQGKTIQKSRKHKEKPRRTKNQEKTKKHQEKSWKKSDFHCVCLRNLQNPRDVWETPGRPCFGRTTTGLRDSEQGQQGSYVVLQQGTTGDRQVEPWKIFGCAFAKVITGPQRGTTTGWHKMLSICHLKACWIYVCIWLVVLNIFKFFFENFDFFWKNCFSFLALNHFKHIEYTYQAHQNQKKIFFFWKSIFVWSFFFGF